MSHLIRTLFLVTTLLIPISIARADYKTYDEALVVARALFQKGDYEGAQRELEKGLPLVTTNEDKLSALTKIGETYYQRKLFSQAREQWEKALQVPDIAVDNRAAARLMIAASYSDEKNWGLARPEFQKVLDIPGIGLNAEWGARLGIFTTYANLDEPDAQKKAYDEIYAILKDAQFSPSNQAKAALFYGDSLKGKKKFDEARVVYREVDNINGVPPTLQLQALFQIVKTYEAENKTKESDDAYSAALTYGVEQGGKLSKADKPEESNALLQMSLAPRKVSPPVRAISYSFIGSNYMELKQWDDAILNLIEAAKEPDVTELAKLAPDDLQWLRRSQTGARVRLARIFIAGDRKELAQKTITELLQDPDATLDTNGRAQLQQMLKSVS